MIRQWCIEWDEGMSDRKVSTEWIYGTAVSVLESSGAVGSLDGYHLWTSVFSRILIQTKVTLQSCCQIKCDNGHASNLQIVRHWIDIWGHSYYHSVKPKSIILLSETSNIYFIGSSSQNDMTWFVSQFHFSQCSNYIYTFSCSSRAEAPGSFKEQWSRYAIRIL